MSGKQVWSPSDFSKGLRARKAALRITGGSPSGTSTVGLIQSRILIANFPGDDFIKPGAGSRQAKNGENQIHVV